MKKKKASAARRKARSAPPYVSVFIRRDEANRNHLAFLGALDRAIKFHSTNANDPHNVGNAVITAITEVRDAFKAYMF